MTHPVLRRAPWDLNLGRGCWSSEYSVWHTTGIAPSTRSECRLSTHLVRVRIRPFHRCVTAGDLLCLAGSQFSLL